MRKCCFCRTEDDGKNVGVSNRSATVIGALGVLDQGSVIRELAAFPGDLYQITQNRHIGETLLAMSPMLIHQELSEATHRGGLNNEV
jgi:hypothetical protein